MESSRQLQHPRKTQTRAAFTLVELLVVIAIIGILVALLLPAVQAARESARRTECSNNFKNTALALHNYHDTHSRFPPGMMEYYASRPVPGTPSGTYFGWGWSALILPQMEEANITDRLNFDSGGYHRPQSRGVLSERIDSYLCPSDPNRNLWVECCSGWSNGPGSTDDVRVTNIAGVADSENMYHGTARAIRTDGDGMFFNMKALNFFDCLDGTSATLFLGEVTGAQGSHPSGGAGYMSYYWASWSIQDVAQGINGPGSIPGGRSDQIDPVDGDGGNRHDELFDEIGFSSYHKTGAHFSMVDASVHFLSENINHDTLKQLTTRDQGETVSQADY